MPEELSDHDQLMRMKWEAEQDRRDRTERDTTLRALVDRLDKATRAKPQIELHDGAVHATCPNCQTETTASLPPAGAPADFDGVIALMGAAHAEAGGKAVKDCPTCRPKFEAKLKELGFEIAPPAPAPTPEG